MLDTDTKRRIDTARDILVGKVPDPKSQVEQITIGTGYGLLAGSAKEYFSNSLNSDIFEHQLRSQKDQ